MEATVCGWNISNALLWITWLESNEWSVQCLTANLEYHFVNTCKQKYAHAQAGHYFNIATYVHETWATVQVDVHATVFSGPTVVVLLHTSSITFHISFLGPGACFEVI